MAEITPILSERQQSSIFIVTSQSQRTKMVGTMDGEVGDLEGENGTIDEFTSVEQEICLAG